MVYLGIIPVIGVILVCNSGFARPRTPQSTRFPKSSENSVGEFVLWSCTATAQLQRNSINNNIVHITPGVGLPTLTDIRSAIGSRTRSNNLHLDHKDDDRVNNIQIIKLNTIPNHHERNKPNADRSANHKDTTISDSPLRTIRVNAFRKNTPVIFRAKPQLPQLEDKPLKKDEIDMHSSEIITVIKSQ
ncbi:uncharacterized protein LOC124408879 [Diprion similis]|uniref:uncharacterized protein LOC124408879 n=1 Tax=Diprion similis TaxID=362088 RepID=UPI001EF89C0A|nr:uncharacterized protein LOC124408879 [Diprion similis]